MKDREITNCSIIETCVGLRPTRTEISYLRSLQHCTSLPAMKLSFHKHLPKLEDQGCYLFQSLGSLTIGQLDIIKIYVSFHGHRENSSLSKNLYWGQIMR